MKLVKPKIEINLKLIYMDGEVKHHYNELQKQAENIKSLASPISLSAESKHSFSELSERTGSLKQLSGPVYLSGDTK